MDNDEKETKEILLAINHGDDPSFCTVVISPEGDNKLLVALRLPTWTLFFIIVPETAEKLRDKLTEKLKELEEING